MKLTKSNKKSILLTGMMTLGLCACALFGINVHKASAEENTAGLTTVPDAELVQLSDDSEVMFYANKTGYPVMRFTAKESYTLKDVTDIAIRVKNAERQANKPNKNGGLCYIQFKFKNDDTIWNLKNENYILGSDGTTKLYTHYTMLKASGTVSKMVGTAKGGDAAKGGMLAVTSGMDGTVYIPLTMIYKDGGLTDADRITAVDGYENFELEYIEFEYSSYRWDIVVGDIATVANSNDTYTETVMSFDKAAQNEVGTLLTDINDEVTIKMNGVEGTAADGKVTASVEGIGSVSVADELRFFTQASVSSDLAAGYGITNVITKMYDAEGKEISAVTSNPLSSGYVYSGKYSFRTNNPENTSDVGLNPVKCVVEVTVTPLAKLSVTGESEGVTVAYGNVDDSDDGIVYLPVNEEAEITVTPKSGFTFTGVKMGDTELTNTATEEGKYSYKVTVASEAELKIIGAGDPINLTVEKVQEAKAAVSIDETTFTEASTTYATNLRKTLNLTVTPDAGYAAKVEKVVAATEEGAEDVITELAADENGVYKFVVDGAFTVRVSTSAVTYTVTYRLNNGALADGETNPETITVLDTVVLNNPTREGYDFLGWEIQGQEGYVDELKNIVSDITVVAKWERKVVVDNSSSESDTSSDTTSDATSDSISGNSSEEGKSASGCQSTVIGGVAAIAALGAAVCAILKKKEN